MIAFNCKSKSGIINKLIISTQILSVTDLLQMHVCFTIKFSQKPYYKMDFDFHEYSQSPNLENLAMRKYSSTGYNT